MKHKITIDLLAAKTMAEQTINTQSSPSSSAPSSESQQQLVLGVASIASVPSSENYSGEDWSVLKKLFPTLGWQSIDGYRDNPQEQSWPYAETAKVGDNLQITVMGARSIIFRSKVALSWTEEHHDNLYIGKEFTPILCDTTEPSTYFERYFSVALPGKKPVYALYTYSEGASSPTGDETLTFGQDLKLPKPGDDADGGKWTAFCQASPAKQSQASGQSAADQKIVSDDSTGPNGQPSQLVTGYMDKLSVTNNGRFHVISVSGWAADLANQKLSESVVVTIDGTPVCNATLHDLRQDVADAHGAAFANSGWHCAYLGQSFSEGRHRVDAWATWHVGSQMYKRMLGDSKTFTSE